MASLSDLASKTAAPEADLDRAKAAVEILTRCIQRAVASAAVEWLQQSLRDVSASNDQSRLVRALGLAPRRLGRADLIVTDHDLRAADALRSGWDLTGLSVDQAARIALVLASYRCDGAAFAETVESLCQTAEVNELIAYYRGLAIFPAAPLLLGRAREGIRSAMTPVFEAVAHRNPYPRAMFDQDAWNQMVLKALFIGSTLEPIQGLEERANPDLAVMLVDYAHERWAAGRPVSPELWRCVGAFADERGIAALARVLDNGDREERLAAARALKACPDIKAEEILRRHGIRA